MADSVQYLEEAEKESQHLTDLLTQADQSMERYLASMNSFTEAHNKPESSTVATIKQALTEVQGVLKSITDRHNQVVSQLQEAKTQAGEDTKDDPYQ